MLIEREDFARAASEAAPLFNAEFEEVGKLRGLPLAVDWRNFLLLSAQGQIAYYTIRDNSKLIGHAGFIIHNPNQHVLSKVALNIVFYIKKEYRKGALALDLMKDFEEDLLSIGVQAIDMTSVPNFQAKKGTLGKLYRFMGYRPIEVIYRKVLTPNNGGKRGRRRSIGTGINQS